MWVLCEGKAFWKFVADIMGAKEKLIILECYEWDRKDAFRKHTWHMPVFIHHEAIICCLKFRAIQSRQIQENVNNLLILKSRLNTFLLLFLDWILQMSNPELLLTSEKKGCLLLTTSKAWHRKNDNVLGNRLGRKWKFSDKKQETDCTFHKFSEFRERLNLGLETRRLNHQSFNSKSSAFWVRIPANYSLIIVVIKNRALLTTFLWTSLPPLINPHFQKYQRYQKINNWRAGFITSFYFC